MSWWNSSPSFCRLYGLLLIGNVQSHTHTLTKIHLCMKKVKTQPANVDSVSCRAAFALFPVSTAVFSFLILTRIAHVTVYAHTVYLVYAGKHKCVCVCVPMCAHTHAVKIHPASIRRRPSSTTQNNSKFSWSHQVKHIGSPTLCCLRRRIRYTTAPSWPRSKYL